MSNRFCRVAGVLAALPCLVAVASAQTKLGHEFQIETKFTGEAGQAAPLPNGQFVVVWKSEGYLPCGKVKYCHHNRMFGQRFSKAGKHVGPEFQIGPKTTHAFPAVTPLRGGGFAVVWGAGGAFSPRDVKVQRFDRSAKPRGPAVSVNTLSAYGLYTPSIAGLSDGGFVVAWERFVEDGDDDVYARRFDAAGNPVGEEFRVNTGTSGFQDGPIVAGLKDGGFVISWLSDDNVFGRRYDSAGDPVEYEFVAKGWPIALKDGGFLMTWASTYFVYPPAGIFGQRYAADGLHFVGPQFKINTSYRHGTSDPHVAVLNGGGFVVTWSTENKVVDDHGLHDVFGQRFDDTAQKVGAEFRVNPNTRGDQVNTSTTGLTNGNFVVIYQNAGHLSGQLYRP